MVQSWLGLIGVRQWEIMSQSPAVWHLWSCWGFTSWGNSNIKLLVALWEKEGEVTMLEHVGYNATAAVSWGQLPVHQQEGEQTAASWWVLRDFFFFYLSSFFLGTCGEISQRGIIQCGSRSLVSEVMEPVIMWYFVDPWGGLSLCCSVGKWEWRISHSTTSFFKHKIQR